MLTREQVNHWLGALTETTRVMPGLLAGSRLRLIARVRLRVQDEDFAHKQIVGRDGKGQEDRTTMLPHRFQHARRELLARAHEQHDNDLAQGFGAAY